MTKNKIAELGWEELSWAPNSPDLAPTDYAVNRSLKNDLRGQDFGNDMQALGAWVKNWYMTKAAGFWVRSITKLEEKCNSVIETDGDYFDE